MAKEMICSNCGFKGKPRTDVKGSFLVELALWFFFILPGVIYTLWRITNRYKVCPKCRKPNIISLDSPIGQKLAHELEPPPEPTETKQPSESEIELPPRDETGRFIIPES